jgi:hypothetical protein
MSEFERLQRIDAIGAGEAVVEIAADEGERAALARRFGWVSLDRLEARFTVRRDAAAILAKGRVEAELVQSCVVTDVPLPARVKEDVALRFLPDDGTRGDELELEADDVDTVFYQGSAIDLGEAAAETLALALDPFPRAPGADEVLKEAGVLSEGEAGPFGGLAALRDALKRD